MFNQIIKTDSDKLVIITPLGILFSVATLNLSIEEIHQIYQDTTNLFSENYILLGFDSKDAFIKIAPNLYLYKTLKKVEPVGDTIQDVFYFKHPEDNSSDIFYFTLEEAVLLSKGVRVSAKSSEYFKGMAQEKEQHYPSAVPQYFEKLMDELPLQTISQFILEQVANNLYRNLNTMLSNTPAESKERITLALKEAGFMLDEKDSGFTVDGNETNLHKIYQLTSLVASTAFSFSTANAQDMYTSLEGINLLSSTYKIDLKNPEKTTKISLLVKSETIPKSELESDAFKELLKYEQLDEVKGTVH